MKESRNVESFALDHTKVRAPYVRLAGKKTGPNGDIVTKFDIRFCQPNEEFMTTGGIHTLEHLMAEYIRDEIDGVIDLSPMGCRTGFYFTVFGGRDEEYIAEKIRNVLVKVAAWPETEEVPGVDPVMCGNYRDHNLSDAKAWAAKWVEGIDNKGWQCF
ncbi:S-ribosylhomocysteine lyase [Brucepastera parasyntrophica]|uniref:S-ribosylhomocysteine lyase n=1 Tax=Brucepastera parasyntrophica TaxID=2880008 RepID=UPI0021089007|nr:S-ribosylhomocysteine lyase [Brucepastera parasyntrophica]ULQ58834.1 S-ribosylhomocysteine lyase [Brucepastera parasyntrophica]